MKLELANRWAVVTGSSSGIGAEFARQLAARGMHLVLVARREDRLQELSQQLHREFGTRTLLVPLDLSAPDGCSELLRQIRTLPEPLTLLVNNAGCGNVATIAGTDPARVQQIIDLNVRVLTELTYALLPEFLERNTGGIINIASVTAFQPIAFMSVYAATKAYVLHLSEGLWAELRGTNVRLLAVCPGTTRTEFFDAAGVDQWLSLNRGQTPAQVVTTSLKHYEKNHAYCVPGWTNWLMTALPRLFSRRSVVLEGKRFFEKHARKNTALAKQQAHATQQANQAPPNA